MTAQRVIDRMRGAGLTLVVGANGALSVRGPRAAYTTELRAAVAGEREALISVLSSSGVNPGNAGDAGDAGDFPTLDVHAGSSLSLSRKFLPAEIGESPASPASPAEFERPASHVEIRTLPVALTRALPLPCTLLVRFKGGAGLSALTSSAARALEARAGGVAVWSPGEYEALAYAVQEERAYASDVATWDTRKRRGGAPLTAGQAMGGAWGPLNMHGAVPEGALTLTWGELLDRLGAELVEVVCEPLPGAQPVQEADEVTL